MKPLMLFATVALVSIVIAVSFGMQIIPTEPTTLSPDVLAQTLYVCPTESMFWDEFAMAIAPFTHYLVMALFFAIMVLAFSWGWALYQNLLTDSFKRDSFKKPWQMTKWLFWASVIVLLFVMTPNYFRTVHVDGMPGEYVLCDSFSGNATAVPANTVHN